MLDSIEVTQYYFWKIVVPSLGSSRKNEMLIFRMEKNSLFQKLLEVMQMFHKISKYSSDTYMKTEVTLTVG